MSDSLSRSSPPSPEEELRLPRPPGVIRRFWARHPLFADILIASICLITSLIPATTFTGVGSYPGANSGTAALQLLSAVTTPLTVVVACLLLLRRRVWPVAAFVASLLVATTYLFAPVPVGGPLLLVTSYSLAVYRSSRACWIGLGVGLASLTFLAVGFASTGVVSFHIAMNAIISEFVMGLIGALIGVNVGNRKRYLEAVIGRSRQLLVERDQHAQLAAAAERDRIAREMHDIVSHSLTVVVALSEGAAATSDRERARDASTAAASTARAALTEMRSMLGVLRDGDGDAPLAPMEPVAPRDTVVAAQNAGYPATLSVAGDPEVPPAIAYAVGRIVQEGMTNAMRHAPRATSISVRIDYAADPLVIEIVNDGVTAARGMDGFGLRGLSERAGHVGGVVHSGPTGDGRWLLHAELPTTTTGASA